MPETRERILRTALHLFARDGYEAVSVSDIAGALGMTKGALYRHYENKRAIFDSIVQRMYQLDAARARGCDVPEHTWAEAPESYRDTAAESILRFTVGQFDFWTKDPFAADFRRMLTLEQYRDPEMAALYSRCLTAGPVAYMEDLFRAMMERGALRQGDPRQLAVAYYAPLLLLIQIADGPDAAGLDCAALLAGHTAAFFRANAPAEEKGGSAHV